MKKITDFIVDKRYWILTLFIILTILATIVSNKVNINYEISKYLPDTSETRIGMDIMEEEFKEIESSDKDTDILPMWIMALAIGCAIIILIIMCESYIEPFLFLATILMAVLLNNGTNIIFDSVSNITSSISAILQMALSMDYSIMLINRYRQERENEPNNKIQAMKNALYNTFTSILSSSVTTIVGLIALVFMSFTIGKDLGFVLAKGVLFSLICIFFVLPSLILIFDKWIEKTKKKVPNFKLDKIGKISYKLRYIAVPVFIFVFISSYLQKGNLNILYTDSADDAISQVFDKNNQMAIIYKNEDEQNISKHLKEIEETEKVNEVLAYGNTINEELKYEEINNKLNELGSDVKIDDYLLKILYYKYYNPDETSKMTFNELITFIQNDVYNNPNLSEKLNNETKQDIEKLKKFTSKELFNKKIDSAEIANILGIDKKQIDDILIYYNSKNNDLKISLNDFIKFMNKDVLTNEKYSKKLDNNAKANLKKLSNYTDKNIIQKQMSSEEMAKMFEIDKNTMDMLYLYYVKTNEIQTKISLYQFSEFVLKDVVTNEAYANLFNESTINNIKILNTFSNQNIINKKMNSKELAQVLGIDENLVKQLYMLIGFIQKNPNMQEMTPNEFVNTILEYSSIEEIKNNIDEKTLETLKMLSNIMQSTINKKSYSYKELSEFIQIDLESTKNIYSLYTFKNESIKQNPYQFVNFMLKHQSDPDLVNKIDKNTINNLTLVKNVMEGVLNNQKYNTKQLNKLLGINENDLNLLYGLYTSKYVKINQTISLKDFVSFLANDVVKNKEYSNNFDKTSKDKIDTINGIINASINNTKYSKDEAFAILSKLTNTLDKNTIDLLYIYYGSNNDYNNEWKLTVEKLVNYLNTDILNDNRFTDFIDEEMKNNIISSKETINDAKEMLIGDKYSRIVINTSFDSESEETFNFIENIKSQLGENVKESYIIGDSLMAYEMNQSFDSELNFITFLTMIAIFIVVAVSFKSIIIPAILVLTIQCAVYMIMGILSFAGEGVYFIALLIVQSILMGATIDYAIVYTSYYLEHRKTMNIKEAIINSYNKSIHTILTSASILIIVTLIVGHFSSAITAMICKTISEGTLCSTILILVLLPAVLAACDKLIIKKKDRIEK